MDNKELLEKARQAKSPEELLAIANENGVDMNEDSAKAYFEQLHNSGELSDDELDGVAGGGCYNRGKLVVTSFHVCDKWTCKYCGEKLVATQGKLLRYKRHRCLVERSEFSINCSNCAHEVYERGLQLCNNPENIK